jgi:hypothetical protein
MSRSGAGASEMLRGVQCRLPRTAGGPAMSSMCVVALGDTNVLVSRHDLPYPDKSLIATEFLRRHLAEGSLHA